MKAIKKKFHCNLELFLPLAAILIGILIMSLSKTISTQAFMPIPMPQTFLGEYSYDAENWYPLEKAGDLSAKNPDLYLRGHFEQPMDQETRLYFYADHIGSAIYMNGELLEQDIILEIEQYGIDVQPSMCCREWKFYFIPEAVSTDTLIEIHIRNPHNFGNKNAYKLFLETLCCAPNEHNFMVKNLEDQGQPFIIIGIILAVVGALLLCSVAVSVFMRLPVGTSVLQTGLLATFLGGYFLMDAVDWSLRCENHILNTYGWQIFVMYSVNLLGIMAKEMLEGKRKKAAGYVTTLSTAVNVVIILLAFSGVILMYDTLPYWVLLQAIVCPVLFICCAGELFSAPKKKTVELIVFLVIFLCILLDCTGIASSIYSTAPLAKSAVIALFLLKLFQFIKRLVVTFRESIRADRLEKELEESRIAIMLSQIQPHFVFNALGTIRGLCREDPNHAWRALGDFSAYLRMNMNTLTNANPIPFSMELNHVQTYLRLEQMRLGEKLNVVYDIQEKNFTIPPLLLQPLVENAVKHGIFYKTEGGTITIRSRCENGKVFLSVQDDGIGFEAAAQKTVYEHREHIGLSNVQKRVEKLLGGQLRIESDPDQGSIVTLEFPVENHS